jgi:phenylpropionate dioxygenase-like ring-hydroxylating dioxygenase large terminal subunit
VALRGGFERMNTFDYGQHKPAPPSFEQAKNLRQRARVAGLDPNYWYAALLSRELPMGAVKEVVFWRRSFALFRGQDGALRCVENRCAHRNLKLSLGQVEGCSLRCAYHGWSYDGEGRLVDVPHNDFGKKLKIKLSSFPVQERHGMIWVFPGDPALASTREIPRIPEIEGPSGWAHDVIDFLWHGHHSMIMDNVSDFTHGYLHRKWRPFEGDELLGMEEGDERVLVHYNSKIAAARIMDMLIDRKAHAGTSHSSCYEYPYQWSNTEEFVKHWLFLWPIDERTTRVFFLFYYRDFKLPLLPFKMPQKLMTPLIRLGHRFLVRPLFDEDGWAVQNEQEGFEKYWDAPLAEVNPQVLAYQRLTVRKWEAYRETQQLQDIKRKGSTQTETADA